MINNKDFTPEMVTWTGWVACYWDHYHACYLMDEEPQYNEIVDEDGEHEEYDGLDYTKHGRLEVVSFEHLIEEMGLNFPIEGLIHDFYYGDESMGRGYAKPMKIQLTLPRYMFGFFNVEV